MSLFRSHPDRRCWHFCENCPNWPWDTDAYEEAENSPPRERWCKTCVRMYIAGTGNLPDFAGAPWDNPTYIALCDAFSEGKLDLRRD